MTVCITVRSLENNSFVLAGDRLFSYGPAALDAMSLKRVSITPDERWKAMFAASPVSHVMPIIRRMRHLLSAGSCKIPYDLDAVRDTAVLAYQQERARLVNENILSKYGTTLIEWKTHALNFGSEEVARINKQLEDYPVGVELIVMGYDSYNTAHLFTIYDPGTYEDCDIEGIAIVGSGGGYAQQSLISRNLPIFSQAGTMCRVLEAKFAAEQDNNVGYDSCAGVVNQPQAPHLDAAERFLQDDEILVVRNAVTNGNTDPFPPDVVTAVKKGIDNSLTHEQIAQRIQELIKKGMIVP